jgi:hypothetical protein
MTASCANPGPLTLPSEVWITAARLARDGYRGRVTARLAPTILAIGLLAAALTACDATPDPVETPPVFASEEEAFAAAEETYRAYVDALNNVDLSDPATFEDVYAWTTGDANAGEKKSLTEMHAQGWTVEGSTEVVSLDPVSYDAPSETVVIDACVDVSDVTVRDQDGNSMVAAERPSTQPSTVSLSASSGPSLLISSIDGGDHEC